MPIYTYSNEEIFFDELNTFTSGIQNNLDTIGLRGGGFVAAYNTQTTNQIYLNFYDASFAAIGAEKTPFSLPTNAVGTPSIAQLSDGSVLVVWSEPTDSVAQLHASLFTATGTAILVDVGLGSGSGDAAFKTPTVTALADGRFVVTFESGGDIFLKTFNTSGGSIVPAGPPPPLAVNEVTAGVQNDNQIAVLTDGGYVVMWTDTDPADQEIKAKIYNANGTVRHAEFRIADGGDNTQPSVAAMKNGNFAVAYTDSGWAEGGTLGNGISLAIFNPDGTAITVDPIHVNNKGAGDEIDPDIAVLDNGFIVVSWSDEYDVGDHDVYYAMFDEAGNRLLIDGSNVSRIAGGNDDEVGSSLSSVLNGRFLAGWQDGFSTDIGGSIMQIVRTTTGDGSDEILIGDSLVDVIFAGGGKDMLNGGSGRSELHGQGGNDTIVLNEALHVSGNVYDGGADTDTLAFGKGGAGKYDLRGDSILSIEALRFEETGYGSVQVSLNANQFGDTGIATSAVIQGVALNDLAETLEVYLGTANSVDLSGLTFVDFANVGDRVVIRGSDAPDTIIATSVNDIIDGGTGADKMTGGLGSDTYYVDNAGDIVTEGKSEGVADTIIASTSYVLAKGVYVEFLQTNDFASTTAPINLTGNELAQTITGNNTANTLSDGGGAGDVLKGLGGNDIYRIASAATTIVEGKDDGTADVVLASTSYTLGKGVYVEFLQTNSTAGTAAINLVGNELSQTIVGNAGINNLSDGGGAGDVLKGLGGNDIYRVASAATTIVEGKDEGTADVVLASTSYTLGKGVYVEFLQTNSTAGTAAIDLVGNELSQTIVGNAGANTLTDGGGAGDVLKGLGGNDIYRVSSAASTIVEGANEGSADRVIASVSYVLNKGAYVEFLETNSATGTTAIDLTGNELSQTILGNAAVNNLTDGGGAGDILQGFGGNDVYRIASAASTIVEGATEGTADVVLASVSFKLNAGAYIEFLQTNSSVGTSNIDLTGNELEQTIVGNAGANRLDGKGGADTLTGRAGADTFVFSTALNLGVDTITDFKAVDDTIELSKSIFTAIGVGVLNADAFAANSSGAATDSLDRIIYQTTTGKLFYDADGSGSGAVAVHFATLTGQPAITNADFVVA